jgi:hypothetical protein
MGRGAGARAVFAVDEADFTAMSAGNLLSQRQPDAATGGLSRIEGYKEILGVGDAQAAIFNANQGLGAGHTPRDANRLSAVGQRCVKGVGKQVDKQLFQLIWIGVEHERRAGIELNVEALVREGPASKQDDALQQGTQGNRAQLGRRQLGQLTIRLDESMEGIGTTLHHAQAAAKVVQRGIVATHLLDTRAQASGNGLDGRKRIG